MRSTQHPNTTKGGYLLSLGYGFCHGEEDTVEEDGGHDQVIEELVCRQENGRPTQRVPWREEEQGLGGREPVDIVLAEPLGHHTERLQGGREKKTGVTPVLPVTVKILLVDVDSKDEM